MNEEYKNGYCLDYCVAKILNISLNEIPHFVLFNYNCIKALRLFLELNQLTTQVVHKDMEGFMSVSFKMYQHLIGVIPVKDESDTHAILLNNDLSLLYDPNNKDHLTDNYKKEDLLYIILINKS